MQSIIINFYMFILHKDKDNYFMRQFREYLLGKGNVPEKQVPYYEAWVSQFYASCDKKPGDSVTLDEIEDFLLELSRQKEDRQTVLPESLKTDLREHLEKVRDLFDQDRGGEVAGVHMPDSLDRKYPNASKEWI